MSWQRAQYLTEIAQNPAFDAVVIGGGVNGIGVYRDLALQGLRVLLVERNDFCSGCSAAPSRMIHGGLRYLENGEFNLVRESLAERDALLNNAPHMVRPLPTLIPITSIFSGIFNAALSFVGGKRKPSSRGALPIKIGLSLYDLVTRKNRILPRHRFRSKSKTRAEWPDLTRQASRSVVYYDAWISHPERLCIELLNDVRDCGSVALNYCEVRYQEDGFDLFDIQTGESIAVMPRLIVNATGAWLDETIETLGCADQLDRLVSGTKGSHLVLDNAELRNALGDHMVYFENSDGRVCVVFPYLGKVLAGSTDIRVDRAKRVRCEPEERDYILASLRLVFPDLSLSEDDVVFSYSGIRPLPHSDEDFTGRISRGHYIKRLDGKVPQFCMIGGKWTTFRAFAEQAADEVLKELGRPRIVSTQNRPIGGGAGFSEASETLELQLQAQFPVSQVRASHLVDLYGTRAAKVAAACQKMGNDEPLVPGSYYSRNEVRWLLREEHAETLSDLVMRRTALAITGEISFLIIDALAEIVSQERGLAPEETEKQRTALVSELSQYHSVSPEALMKRNNKGKTKCV